MTRVAQYEKLSIHNITAANADVLQSSISSGRVLPGPLGPPAPYYYPIGREGAYILQSNVTQAPDHQGIDTPTTITYPPMSCRKTNGLYQNHYPFSTPILCKSSKATLYLKFLTKNFSLRSNSPYIAKV